MPLSVDQSLSKARRHAKRGEAEQAAAIYRRVLERFPDNRKALEALNSLEPQQAKIEALIALYRQGRLDDALTQAEALAHGFPGSAVLANVLGAINAGLDRLEAAVEHYERAIGLAPDYAEARNNLADSLNGLGKPKAAIETLTRALEIEPDFAEARNNLGNAYYLRGELDAARQSYERAVALMPDYAEAHRNLSNVKTFVEADDQVQRMQALLAAPGASARQRMNLSFALGKAYDDFGAYDEAFAYFAEGNRLRKTELPYALANDADRFARIALAFADELPAAADSAAPSADQVSATSGSDQDTPTPIFIVGMPRSGTTLVEQIFASHSAVGAAGELTLLDRIVRASGWDRAGLDRERLARVRTDYLAGLASRCPGARYVTDKMPLNFQWLGFVCLAIPEAVIVHVERDPQATCWSNFRHFFSSSGNRFANDLEDVANYYRLYRDLMAFWHARFPERILDLRYETLTESQESETRRLLDHAGLDWETACLQFHRTERTVPTASATQVRREIYRGSSAAWLNYASKLGPMLAALDRDQRTPAD